MIIIKNEEQISGIRESCALTAKTLDYIAPFVVADVSTLYLNDLIDKFIRDNNAIPAPLNYHGFPKSICTSINEVVCHGIPSSSDILKDGDILNIDVSTILNGYFGDASRMYAIGDISSSASNLLKITSECLEIGIGQCYPGNYFGNIGYEINKHAVNHGMSVVFEYVGHGIGENFHELPSIFHVAPKDSGEIMKPGMIFTCEPMINQGVANTILSENDGWTVYTKDKKLSAQEEHTILITETGCDVLTK